MEEIVTAIDEALASPDPNPDLLPAIPPGFVLQEQTAQHLVRAILRCEASVERLEAAMEADIQAWKHLVASMQSKADSWRAVVKDWLLRNDVKQLKSPWATAFIQKGQRRLSWEQEDAVIAILDALGAGEAIQVRRSVKKKEFQTIFDSVPKEFKDVVKDEVGDSVLVIRGTK